MKDNNIAQDKGKDEEVVRKSYRSDAIMKRLNEIVKEHPEIVVKPGVYDYSRAPPEVQAEIEEHFEELTSLYYEEVFWHLAEYYYLREANLPMDPSLAEYLLTEKERGAVFIPDSVIKDLLERFPELKGAHPEIHKALGQKNIELNKEKEFYLLNIRDEEVQSLYREVENIAKAGVEGVMFEREKGAVHINYERANTEVKKVLDETVEKILEKITEFIVKNVAFYYFLMLNDPSRLEFLDAQIVVYAKAIGMYFVPHDVVVDALNRFPKLRELYPDVAEKYKS
ncbi:MAG: hypothetical protein RXR19_03355, partial [Nitrososphaeria archaeon]